MTTLELWVHVLNLIIVTIVLVVAVVAVVLLSKSNERLYKKNITRQYTLEEEPELEEHEPWCRYTDRVALTRRVVEYGWLIDICSECASIRNVSGKA